MSMLARKEFLSMMSPLNVLIALLLLFKTTFVETQSRASSRPTILTSVPSTSFSCLGRPSGYYADVETGCQAYHMCGMNGRKYSYLCPSYTLFHQKFMVCDHRRRVDCSVTEKYYDLNLKIGKVPGKDNKKKATTPKPKKETLFKTAPKQDRSNKATSEINPPEVKRPPVTVNLNPLQISTKLKPPGIDKNSDLREPERVVQPSTRLTPKNPAPKMRFQFERPPKPEVSPAPLNSFPLRPLSKRGRGSSGRKFLFSGAANKELRESRNVDGLKFHPIVIRPIRNLFEEESFTIAPEILIEPTFIPPVEEEEDLNLKPIEIEDDFPAIPGFLIPPLPSSNEEELFSTPNISTFLLPPPPEAPIVIEGPNQEKKTPLIFSKKGIFNKFEDRRFSFRESRQGHPTNSGIFFSSPSLRGNPDFFIPSPGLLPPLEGNTLDDNFRGSHLDDPHHKMTMTFPNSGKHSFGLAPLALNPNCPQCHPAFLRRNQCRPCVIIK